MSTSSLLPVEVPDIGDFDQVPIIEIHVSPGERVAAEDPLVTLESDKATMDVPAPVPGVVRELLVSVGDHVSQGSPLLTLAPEDAAAATDAVQDDYRAEAGADGDGAPDAAAQATARGAAGSASPESADSSEAIYASPSVRRLARELSVDLSGVSGSGRRGRITPQDVRASASRAQQVPARTSDVPPADAGQGLPGLAPWPALEFEKFGPVERVSRSRIQRISAPNLARNWALIPHVTHHDEADITELEAWRRRLGEEQRRGAHSERGAEGRSEDQEPVKVTMVSFLVIASVTTLKAFPEFNSSLDGDELILKRYYNIGFAADTPEGLVVPVIKDADRKGLLEIARELGQLSATARAGRLSPAEMAGSTFTISSVGGIGGTSFTPIVNAPEVAILGATRATMKPVWDGEQFQPRLMLPLSLSYDHRVIDGAAAARFMVHLVAVLSDLRRALL